MKDDEWVSRVVACKDIQSGEEYHRFWCNKCYTTRSISDTTLSTKYWCRKCGKERRKVDNIHSLTEKYAGISRHGHTILKAISEKTLLTNEGVKISERVFNRPEKTGACKQKKEKVPKYLIAYKHTHYKVIFQRYSVSKEWGSFERFSNDTYNSKVRGHMLAPLNDALPIGPTNFEWIPSGSLTRTKIQNIVDSCYHGKASLISRNSNTLTLTCNEGHIFTRAITSLRIFRSEVKYSFCPECEENKKNANIEKAALLRRKKLDKYKQKLEEVFGGTVTISGEYSKTMTRFECSICDESFDYSPTELLKRVECPSCKAKKFYDQVNDRFGGRVEVLSFIGWRKPAKFRCSCGNVYKKKEAVDVLSMTHGCRKCAKSTLKYDEPTSLYYVRLSTESGTYYKIGITQQSPIEKRFERECRKSELAIICAWDFPTGMDAYIVEQEVITENSAHLVHKDAQILKKTGNSEIFTTDILYLDTPKPLTPA